MIFLSSSTFDESLSFGEISATQGLLTILFTGTVALDGLSPWGFHACDPSESPEVRPAEGGLSAKKSFTQGGESLKTNEKMSGGCFFSQDFATWDLHAFKASLNSVA